MRARVDARQVLTSLAAVAGLLALLVLPPWVLSLHVGWPLPAEVPSLDSIRDALAGSSIDDGTIVKALALVCWLAWSQIVLSVVVEVDAWRRGRSALRLPAGFLQPLARRLVLSALVLGAGLRSTSPFPVRASLPTLALAVQISQPATQEAPDTAAAPAQTAAARPTGMVRHRDSLWRLAETHLGEGLRWRELWELNRGREFPDGRVLADPDLIHPGWVLYFPADAAGLDPVPPMPPATEARSATTGPSAECGPAEPIPTPTIAADQTAVSTTSPTVVDLPAASVPDVEPLSGDPSGTTGVEDAADDGSLAPVELIAGGLLAAGLVTTVRRMQRIRQRQRTPGREAERGDPESVRTEAILRSAAALEPVERLDVAMRALAGVMSRARSEVPQIEVVSVDGVGAVEVLLAGPLDAPPEVFAVEADNRAWSLPAATAQNEVELAAAGLSTLAPALAEVGLLDERSVLVDLEAPALTAVVGDEELSRRVLLSMAYGLATTVAADEVQVVFLGDAPPGLAELDRVEVTSELASLVRRLEKQAKATAESLVNGGWSTTLAARVANPADLWTPTVVFVSDARCELTSLLRVAEPGSGIACVAVRVDPAAFDRVLRCAGDQVVIEPLGLRLSTSALSPELLDAVGLLIEQATSVEPGPELDIEPPVDLQPLQPVEPSVDEAATAAPPRPPWDGEPAATDEIHVRVLGPVEITGGVRKIDRRRSEELVAYLSLHPEGVDEGRLKAALWPDGSPSHSFNQTVSRARSCLGAAAEGGFHVPHCTAGLYSLGPMVKSDFRLLADALNHARGEPSPVAVDALVEMLGVVRGIPFEGTKRGWEWVYNEGLAGHITSVVSEAAHVVATCALDRGDPKLAVWATVQGVKASPGDEILYRDRMLAHDLEGNPAGVEATMDELLKVIEADDPACSVHPETLDLYERLSRRKRRTG